MRRDSDRPLLTLRSVIIVLWLLLLALAVGGIFYEGNLVSHAPAESAPAMQTPSQHPPTGRTWFYDRQLWFVPSNP